MSVNVEENYETHTAQEGEEALHQHGILDGENGDRCYPDGRGKLPGSSCAQRNGNGCQGDLNDPVDTGIGVTVDDVSHSIGEQ